MAIFKDLLKKWFYTNNSSAASSDARIPLLNADGTPKGSDKIANIASILGVGNYSTGIDVPVDFNTLTNGGYYWVNAANNTNAPTSGRFFLIVYKRDRDVICQLAIDASASGINGVYARQKWGSWSAWSRCDNFGCSTPADLASLLGEYPATQVFSDSDFNTFTNYGFYWWNNASSVPQLNKPTNLAGGSFCLVLRCDAFIIQITMTGYFGADTGDVFYRIGYGGNNWGKWYVVSHTVA